LHRSSVRRTTFCWGSGDVRRDDTVTDFTTLRLSQPHSHIDVVTLNRPSVANAMNTQMGRELESYFSELVRDPGDRRCVIIIGVGENAFCAGGDLKERHG